MNLAYILSLLLLILITVQSKSQVWQDCRILSLRMRDDSCSNSYQSQSTNKNGQKGRNILFVPMKLRDGCKPHDNSMSDSLLFHYFSFWVRITEISLRPSVSAAFLPAPFSGRKCDFCLQIQFLPYFRHEIIEICITWNFLLITMIKAYNCN